MELAKIEKLLEAYFEGIYSLEEEKLLRKYFTSDAVAPQFKVYKPLFESYAIAQEEVSKRELIVSNRNMPFSKLWRYGIAASIAAVGLITLLMFSSLSLSQDEEAALAAFNESKKAMLLLADNFNNGAEQLALLNQFTESKNSILK
jgi:type VI protein secretion system component VasF